MHNGADQANAGNGTETAEPPERRRSEPGLQRDGGFAAGVYRGQPRTGCGGYFRGSFGHRMKMERSVFT